MSVFRSRWVGCENCGSVTIIENRYSKDGVPEPVDWEEFGTCLVCGKSQHHWNADEETVDDHYFARGMNAARVRVTSVMRKRWDEDVDRVAVANAWSALVAAGLADPDAEAGIYRVG